MKHYLKTLSCYYQKVVSGEKTFELRKNDRNFKVGDILILREIDDKGNYTGNEITKKVVYILESEEFLQPEYVAMSLK